jgi:hypothetical protein
MESFTDILYQKMMKIGRQRFVPLLNPIKIKPGDTLKVMWDVGGKGEIVKLAVVPALAPGATRHKALPDRCLQLPSGAAFMLGRNDLT